MPKCPQCTFDPDEEYIAWKLTYNGKVPSQNQLKGNTRYAYNYRRWRASFQKQLETQFAEIPKAEIARTGIITRYIGAKCRVYDLENFIGGCKPLIDVLKRNGVIVDDAPKWWRGHYHQNKSPDGEHRLEIEIRQAVPVPTSE